MTSSSEVGSAASSYEILAKLAEGGMAEIFLARGASAAGIERYVVLKRILRERAHDVEFVRMFLEEARLAAQLQHPNVAQVYDVGRLGDSYFFTMEYVHGETVRALIHKARALGKPVPIGCALAIAAGAAAGLHHAHERKGAGGRALGIVHRDVSPSNLMVTYEGHVKVVDFGVAKATDRGHQTAHGSVKGKICYLAPEQCGTGAIDRRSDLFALGIVLWEMLVGDGLYRRDSDFLIMTAISEEPPPPPSSRRRDVPPEVDAIVLRLLAKQPAERFQTGRELVDAIETIAERSGLALTASTLARLMRERFGERVEPWVDLEATRNPSIVTVRSDPIPDRLAPPPSTDADSELDAQLKSVINLTPPAIDDDAKPTLLEQPHHATGLPTVADLPPAPTVAELPPAPTTVGRRARPSAPARAPTRARPRTPWLVAAVALAIVVIVLVVAQPWRARARAARPPPSEDARVVVVAPPADAQIAAEPPPPPAAPDAAVATAPPPPVDAAIDDLARAYDDGRFGDVVAACSADATRAADHLDACVTAACRVGDRGAADRWLAHVRPRQRAALVVRCRAAGVELGPRVDHRPRIDAGDPCKLDPMACQQ